MAQVPPPLLPPSGRAFAPAAADALVRAIAASDGSRSDVAANLFGLRIDDGPVGDLDLDGQGEPVSPTFALYRADETLRAFATVTPPAWLVREAGLG